jgi:hypothetical protein
MIGCGSTTDKPDQLIFREEEGTAGMNRIPSSMD